MDYEVSRKVWDTKIPVEITLESDDLIEPIKPYYIMVQRCSYFCLVLPKAVQYFLAGNESITIDQESLWLEYNRQPLKTYYPVGVLYDLNRADDSLPWKISLRTKNKPDSISTVSRETVQAMFMQTVKEADYLKRKGDVITNMKSEDHKQLWNGVATNQFEEFWSINRRLMKCSDSDPFLHIPIRLYEIGVPFKQCPVEPSINGHPTTLDEAVKLLYRDFPMSIYKLISHGIEIPLSTPLIWMARNFSYPDNFVHVCAVKDTKSN